MKNFLIAYGAAIVAFLVIDGIWLGLVAKDFYADNLGDLLRKDFLLLPGVIFYLMFTAGLVFLAVRPGQPDISLLNVALHGAVVGLLAYGTYDLTNLSTLRGWSPLLSIVDMVWGTVLSASVALSSAVCVRYFS
ncbi:MAG: putative membrane protein [Granulosicoccus sp.]|jgi:uncharacterized membrane protein